MADAATMTMKAVLLPDEIQATLKDLTFSYTPADANDKWYYKLTSVSNSSTDLMAGDFIDYTAVDDDTATTAVSTSDKVNFLLEYKDICSFSERCTNSSLRCKRNTSPI